MNKNKLPDRERANFEAWANYNPRIFIVALAGSIVLTTYLVSRQRWALAFFCAIVALFQVFSLLAIGGAKRFLRELEDDHEV